MIFDIYNKYAEFKEDSLTSRRMTHRDMQQCLSRYVNKFVIKKIGKSFEKREIYNVQIGDGEVPILLWSQMHGNESTATMAMFDIFNFFADTKYFMDFKSLILKNLSLFFIPMLNPDGADRFIRRNAQGIDLNRDAIRLSAHESIVLKQELYKIHPEFAFNLHDQDLYYGIEDSDYPTCMAFLTPAFNRAKTINVSRERSMKLIAEMVSLLQNFIPNQIAKYSDSYLPNAFGDFVQGFGASTILIESGYYPDDLERQFVRKLNFISILHALYSIATRNYLSRDMEEYQCIPFNVRDVFFDYLLKNVTVRRNDISYVVDIGISREKFDKESFTDYVENYLIWEIGDLTQYKGHVTRNMEGHTILDSENKIRKYADAKWLIDEINN